LEAIVIRRALDCVSPPKALFALLADSERLNRALGQAPLTREPLSSEGAARYLLRTRTGRRSIAFAEPPPQWIAPSYLSIRRLLHRGALASLEIKYRLTPLLAGTKLEVELMMVPRFPALAPLIQLTALIAMWNQLRVLHQLDGAHTRGDNLLHQPVILDEEALLRAQSHVAQNLPGEQHPLLAKLAGHLRGLDDLDADTLQPYALAAAWGHSRESLLTVFLTAAAHGLLQLSWDVLCPSCRQPASRHGKLSDLDEESYCQLCDLRVPIDFERSVEVTFRPTSEVRPYEQAVYASCSPSQSAHVLVQQLLPASGQTQLVAPTEPGEYQLFARGGPSGRLLVSTLGPPQARITVTDTIAPPRVEVAMGGTLEIAHPTPQARHFKLERIDWPRNSLSGHAVTLHPMFRKLFADQLLRPGVLREVPYVALWLSELVGGPELCAQLGDGGAFRVVQEHFELLRFGIEQEQGSLIKTERDSVLAAFQTSEAAIRSALSAQRAMATFRSANPKAAALALRIGMYAGPCHLVTQNSRLDYYGQTLLLCTRMLREAHAGDILLPADLGDKLGKIPGLRVGPRFVLTVKGITDPVPVVRVNLDRPEAGYFEPSSRFQIV